MASEWEAFSTLFSEPQKNGLTRSKKVRGAGYPMVNMGELFAFPRIFPMKMDRVPVGDKERSYVLEPGDLLFARQSLVFEGAGKCSIFLGDHEPSVFESHIIRCRLNRQKADPLFYFYFFQSLQGRDAISSIVEQGAGAAGIRASDLARLMVPVPPLDLQHSASAVLDALDARIELLRRTNDSLEAIARTVFKSWFVDFDPVRAKAGGREPEGMDAETAALFPSEFKETQWGTIPEGWNVVTVGELAEFAYGKPLKAENRKGGSVPVMGSNGRIGWHNEALTKGPGIVVGRKGNPGIVTWVDSDFFPIDTTFYVRQKGPAAGLHLLKYQLDFLDLPGLSADSAVPGLNREMAYQTKLANPPVALTAQFENLVGPIMQKVALNERSIATLSETRDTLLPRLLSGKLPVPDAEKLVEAVL